MRILFATDGSRGANAAAKLIATLPLQREDEVDVVTVVADGKEPEGEAALASALLELEHGDATLDTELRWGNPLEEILEAAAERHTDLLVLGSHGHTALDRFFVGSVAERVTRHAHCPVMVVRPGAEKLREVLVGVDGSESAAEAGRWLRDFPLPADAESRLLTAMPNWSEIASTHFPLIPPLVDHVQTLDEHERTEARERLAKLEAEFAAAGKKATTETRAGDPDRVLLLAAREQGADLIVVGSHAAGAAERFLIGSVSERVLRHAHCSVLVVKK